MNRTLTFDRRAVQNHHVTSSCPLAIALKRRKRAAVVVGVVFDAGGAVGVQGDVLIDDAASFAFPTVVAAGAAGVFPVQNQSGTTPRTVAACEAKAPEFLESSESNHRHHHHHYHQQTQHQTQQHNIKHSNTHERTTTDDDRRWRRHHLIAQRRTDDFHCSSTATTPTSTHAPGLDLSQMPQQRFQTSSS